MFNKLSLFLLLIIYSVDVFPEKRNVEETYIAISVSKNLGDAYYKVYVDDEEDPYVNIQDFLTNYLGFDNVRCDVPRGYCECTKPPDGTFFWIHAKTGSFGSSSGGSKRFDPSTMVIRENSLWLKYDVFGQWLPLDASWNLDNYSLKMTPKFKLLYEKKIERQEMLRKLKLTQERKEYEAKQEVITPPITNLDASVKYRLGLVKRPLQETTQYTDYEATVDVLGGTGKVGQTMNFPFNSRRVIDTPYETYTLKNKKYFYLMEVGTTYFQDNNLLLPSGVSDYGFRFDSRKRDAYSGGKITITDIAPVGTEVDLYIDGYYMDTAIADNMGRYTFPEITIMGSSTVKLKIFYPDGLEEDQDVNISQDGGNKLAAGEFEERAFAGKMKGTDDLYYTFVRYGVLDNLSFGGGATMMPDSKKMSVLLDTYFMPFYWVNFFAQALVTGKTVDRSFRVNLNFLYPNFFQVEHRYYNPDSPLVQGFSSTEGEYWAGRHQLNWGRWAINSEYIQDSAYRKYRPSVGFMITRYLKPYVDAEINWPMASGYANYSVGTGLNINFTEYSRLDISRLWANTTSRNIAELSIRNMSQIYGWDVSFRAEYDDDGSKSFTSNVLYRITKNIQIGVLTDGKYLGAQIYWNDVLSGKHGPKLYDQFDTGTLSGEIMEPSLKGEKPAPIEDVTVYGAGRSGISDNKGEYITRGIQSEEVVKARVDTSTLDSRLIPEREYELMYFRRGTNIEWDPKLFPTIGVDGYVDTASDIGDKTKIKAVRIKDSRVISETDVDSDDGFFVLEKLIPGDYKLVLEGMDKNIPPVKIDIKATTEWISGARWNIDNGMLSFEKESISAPEAGETLNEDSITEAPKQPEKEITKWTGLLGIEGKETEASAIINDGFGGIFVSGQTASKYALVAKYDDIGKKKWARVLGKESYRTIATALNGDQLGHVYIAGWTQGNLDGEVLLGNRDAFVVKYNSVGKKQWTKLIGSQGQNTVATGVTSDKDNNTYVTGWTTGSLNGEVITGVKDAFITKFAPDGTIKWTKLLGVAKKSTENVGITSDEDKNVYTVGRTDTSFILISKYNSNGDKQWVKVMGVEDQGISASGIVYDKKGSVYVTGWTKGSLDGETINGLRDSFITKYTSSGTKQWTKLIGVPDRQTLSTGITSDQDGSIYVTGCTNGSLDGEMLIGSVDFFVTKYSLNGTRQWTKLSGSEGRSTLATGITSDMNKVVYVTGYTNGGLDDKERKGVKDLFITNRINP
ncbi:MAG: SBBP repeat-containing protein [Pseudomonadota bacterium]